MTEKEFEPEESFSEGFLLIFFINFILGILTSKSIDHIIATSGKDLYNQYRSNHPSYICCTCYRLRIFRHWSTSTT